MSSSESFDLRIILHPILFTSLWHSPRLESLLLYCLIHSMRVYWSWYAQHIAQSWDKVSPFQYFMIRKVTFQLSCNLYSHLFNRHLFTYDYMNHISKRYFSRQILTDTVSGWQNLTVPCVDFELRSIMPILGCQHLHPGKEVSLISMIAVKSPVCHCFPEHGIF